jgi:hypothetical protein
MVERHHRTTFDDRGNYSGMTLSTLVPFPDGLAATWIK